eukprot:TRINITY_DN50819_c0_g1_i1.p1 TRINITY_DN50819_c0_g1~~TRINITY_DN50819_c0_g1_i1.p1  ORF type:complete len:423 (-),score=78.70 TRINITY_DN50819_c0_g1_i1:210-1478(-)
MARRTLPSDLTLESLEHLSLQSSDTSPRGLPSEPSVFEQRLPQDVEDITVQIPRGLRFALHEKLAGFSEAGDDISTRPVKQYVVKVEPHARDGSKQLQLRRLARGNRKPHSVKLELPEVRFDDTVKDAIIDERHGRAVFRSDRLQSWDMNKHVPCLTCPKLIPSWRGATAEEVDTPAVEAQKKIQAAFQMMQEKRRSTRIGRKRRMRFVTPTFSIAMKRNQKVLPQNDHGLWMMTGETEARRNLFAPHEHNAAEYDGLAKCDALLKRAQEEVKQAKQRFVGDPLIRPTGVVPVSLLDERQAEVEAHVADVRCKGKEMLQSLKFAYDNKRETFKKATKARGTESAFDRFYTDYKANQRSLEERKQQAMKEQEEMKAKHVRSSLANVMSLGLARVKKDEPRRGSEGPTGRIRFSGGTAGNAADM